MKLITFAVPCYNSAAYMGHCIDTILEGGADEDIEIILINDGSKDNTGEIADAYAASHPEIIRVIHQENGGHGEGVNQGLRNARGIYYKVIDSDDWVDAPALKRVLRQLSVLSKGEKPLDMMIVNYVYEHAEDNSQYTMQYKNVFPEDQIFTWNDIKHFRISQYMMMHSVIYRTQVLRDCGLELPKHTFYVDNIFVYQPLPYMET
ncbi:MAG: glycosyltransferase family 2 protein, partial [Oscillospiraceae bacterium]|nr:glycosyltransferase family 2 protein [Oscillospiraceae bacterium]